MIIISFKDDFSYLNNVYKEIADEFGIDIARRFYQNFKGLQISFPVRFMKKEYVISQVKREYDGKNIQKLASEYGYSERWLRAMLNKSSVDNSLRKER